MQRNKLIILISGIVLLIILTSMLFILEQEEITTPNRTQTNVEVTDENQNENQNTNVNTTDDSRENNDGSVNHEGNLPDDDEQDFRENAKEAISNTPLNEEATELTEDTLYEHSLLHQTYQLMRDEHVINEEEDMEDNAQWMSTELNGWLDYATENYDFEYSSADFIHFIEDESYMEEEDMSTIILFEELSNMNENLLHRQLEFHYLKSFIWDSINDQVATKHSNNNEDVLDDENENYLLFRQFEQKVMQDLSEKHPELYEGE